LMQKSRAGKGGDAGSQARYPARNTAY